MFIKVNLFLFLTGMMFFLSGAEYKCSFEPGGWNEKDWQFVRCARWTYEGKWIQKDGYIQNVVPDGVSQNDLQGKRAGETYTSMVLAEPRKGRSSISAEMSFDYKMAPLIVLAGPVSKAEGSSYPVYGEHWEIVLYNGGINVWHHEIKNGKQYWRKAAYVNAKFEAGKKYTLNARVTFPAKTPMLEVSCENVKFGCMLPTLPKEYSVGITGCEGINRFYSFSVK